MENKYKHLMMIENIIERMAKNSFMLKGWAMTLVVLIGSFASQGSNPNYIVIAFLPILSFWLLDAFYLQRERKYRILYKNVKEKEESEIDFNLNINKIYVSSEETKKLCYCNCLFSFTELVFYVPIALGTIALVILLFVI